MLKVAAIMAGGRGERLWPCSRGRLPKQFLNLADGPSFLQQAFDRVAGMPEMPQVAVLTSAATADVVREQLPHLPPDHVLAEPVGRDTAATAALALVLARALAGGEALLTLLPADHAVFDTEAFRACLRTAWQAAEAQACPVLVGIRPSRPETGYGYIRLGNPMGAAGWTASAAVFVVERFVEKPSVERAAEFLADGRYLWNIGMCVCRTDVLYRALVVHQPELRAFVDALAGVHPGQIPPAVLDAPMRALRPISFDYAVLERVERALVVEAGFAWDDVGGWEALTRLHPQDASGNVCVGHAVLSETERTVVYGREAGRLVVTHGVHDLVVIDAPDSLLVAERSALPGLKRALGAVRASGFEVHLDEVAAPAVRSVAQPWGHAVALAESGVRILSLRAGATVTFDDPQVVGLALRLVSGEATVVRAGTGAGRPLSPRRARVLPPGALLRTDGGCVLAVQGARVGATGIGGADEVSAAGASGGTPEAGTPSGLAEGHGPAGVVWGEDPIHMAPEHCRTVDKPWGREVWWAVSEGYAGKRLEVRAGHALSLQYHEEKHETLYFLEGQVRLHLGEREIQVGPGHVAVIPPGTVHRMEALTDAVIFEVSTPELDDVVRLEDRYGRTGPVTSVER